MRSLFSLVPGSRHWAVGTRTERCKSWLSAPRFGFLEILDFNLDRSGPFERDVLGRGQEPSQASPGIQRLSKVDCGRAGLRGQTQGFFRLADFLRPDRLAASTSRTASRWRGTTELASHRITAAHRHDKGDLVMESQTTRWKTHRNLQLC